MNIENLSKTELKQELLKIISKLKSSALYNLSIRKVQDMSKEPEWFKSYRIKQENFNEEVINRLDNIEKDIILIKNCPTIKQELKQ